MSVTANVWAPFAFLNVTAGWWALFVWVCLVVALCLLLCWWFCGRRHGKDRVDQLEAIEGIGPKIAELLRDKGVLTFLDLSKRSVDGLRTILHQAGSHAVGPTDPASWPSQAKLLAFGNIDGFLKLALVLSDGRVPLEALAGVGTGPLARSLEHSATGDSLRAAGIHSLEVLAETSAADLQGHAGGGIATVDAERWIAQAQRFEEGDPAEYLKLVGIKQFEAAPPVTDPSTLVANSSGAGACILCIWLWFPAAILLALPFFMKFDRNDPVPVCPTGQSCQPICDGPGCVQCRAPDFVCIPPPPPPPPCCVPDRPSVILFDFDQWQDWGITPPGKKTLDDLVAKWKASKSPAPSIRVEGTADRSGQLLNSSRNRFLADSRARTVANYLNAKIGDARPFLAASAAEPFMPARSPETANCAIDARTGKATHPIGENCLWVDRHVTIGPIEGLAAPGSSASAASK